MFGHQLGPIQHHGDMREVWCPTWVSRSLRHAPCVTLATRTHPPTSTRFRDHDKTNSYPYIWGRFALKRLSYCEMPQFLLECMDTNDKEISMVSETFPKKWFNIKNNWSFKLLRSFNPWKTHSNAVSWKHYQEQASPTPATTWTPVCCGCLPSLGIRQVIRLAKMVSHNTSVGRRLRGGRVFLSISMILSIIDIYHISSLW